MAVVYILHSPSIEAYYIGSCKDLEQRLLEHRCKVYKSSFTSRANDWELFLKIDNLRYHQARKMETHIKRMKSRIYIENLHRFPEMVERLKSQYL